MQETFTILYSQGAICDQEQRGRGVGGGHGERGADFLVTVGKTGFQHSGTSSSAGRDLAVVEKIPASLSQIAP